MFKVAEGIDSGYQPYAADTRGRAESVNGLKLGEPNLKEIEENTLSDSPD